MKIWTSFGSGHSAQLTVVGQFKTPKDAELMEQAVEDFVNAHFDDRYPNAKGFGEAWEGRLPGITMLGPKESEYDMGIDQSPDVSRAGAAVTVSRIRTAEIGGIIKLMLLKDPTSVNVTGRTGP